MLRKALLMLDYSCTVEAQECFSCILSRGRKNLKTWTKREKNSIETNAGLAGRSAV